MNETIPGGDVFQPDSDRAAYVNVAASHKDAVTGATWVHKDLVQVQDAWAEEAHIGPVEELVQVGDIESFAGYVQKYSGLEPQEDGTQGDDRATLITWNGARLMAVLDYHTSTPGRCQWRVEHRFARSREWLAWTGLCASAVTQAQAVDKLEDLADGIIEPASADLMTIVRGLRANVKREAVSEFLENGDTKFSFKAETSVNSTARGADMTTVTLPSQIRIRIPVLAGHMTEQDTKQVPVVYDLDVKVRSAVDGDGHVTLRFSMPQAEKVLETVIAERVAAAKAALGAAFTVYRAAE